MSKTKLLIGLVVIVLVVGVGYSMFTGGSSYKSFVGTIPELRKIGEDLKCTFTHTDQFVNMTGTIYIEGGDNMRMDSMVTTPELGDIETFIIADQEYSYMWSLALEEGGIKVKIPEEEEDLEDDTTIDESVSSDDIEYSCEKWVVDSSYFILPEGVEFEDFDEKMLELEQELLGDDVDSMQFDIDDFNLEELELQSQQ